MVQSLRNLCEDAFSKVAEGLGYPTYHVTFVHKVFVVVNGVRELYTHAHSMEELWEVEDCATKQGLYIKVEKNCAIYEETCGYSVIAKAAETRISRICNSWAKYPKRANESSAVKLIIAYYHAASCFARLGVTSEINQFAKAGWEDVEEIRDDIDEILNKPGAPRMNVGTKVVRDRIKTLGAKFGSPKNLHQFMDALDLYNWRREEGKFHDKAYTKVSWRPGLIQWKDEATLFRLLVKNLGQEYVKVIVKRGEKPYWFPTSITPAELAELIGLKLAIGMRHEATDVEEISEMDAHTRTIARYLQDRTDRPAMGSGTKHPKELAKKPELRDNAPDIDHGIIHCSQVKTSGRTRTVIGGMRHRDTWVEEIEREVTVAQVGTPVTTKKVTTTDKFTRFIWVKSFKTPDGRTMYDRVGKTFSHKSTGTRQVRKPTYHKALMTKLDAEGNVIGTEEYMALDRKRVETITVKEQVISSNAVILPMPKPVRRDWETFLSVKSPTTFVDHRLPKVDGSFPEVYVGPSLVVVERGVPVKADRCTMHDGRLWFLWKKAGSHGECPVCPHTHITKVMIREDHWAPMINVVNQHEDENGEKYTTSCIVPARTERKDDDGKTIKLMGIEEEPSATGKTTKEVLKFYEDGMFMPLLVPDFKSHVYECMVEGRFVAPPILEEVMKHGVLTGRHRDQLEAIEREIQLMEDEGNPDLSELYEELDKMEALRKTFDRVYHQIHLFLPMESTLFRRKAMPEGWLNMGIRVQISGSRLHELEFIKEHNGLRLRTQYMENDSSEWIEIRRDWTQY
jgi:hypothetical protein